MTTYRVEFRPSAAKSLKKLDRPDRLRIQGAIELLKSNPHPPNSRPLVGSPYWRVRVGDYRVIYTIDNGALVVLVLAIGHRRDVYR